MTLNSNHHSERRAKSLEQHKRSLDKAWSFVVPILVVIGSILITVGISICHQDVTDFWNHLVHGFKSGLRDLFSH